MNAQYIGAAVTVLIAVMLGGIGMFVVGKRQGQRLGETAVDANEILQRLANETQGHFEAAGLVSHPLQGTRENYGKTRLIRHNLRIEVTLGYPPLYDNDFWTILFVYAPPGKRWLIPTFSFQNDPQSMSLEAISRSLRLPASSLSAEAKSRLFALAQQANYLSFDGRGLQFIPQVSRTWFGPSYIRDVPTLARLVEAASETANALVGPGPREKF